MSPYLSLLRAAWLYAREKRPRFALVYAMFIASNLIEAVEPLLYGWFIDRVQGDPAGVLRAALVYGGALCALKLGVWCLHGPARVMEVRLALDLSGNFLRRRFGQALRLPLKWHQDHHSGATINRVRKAYEALREFFSEGFVHLQSFSRLVICLAAMTWFSPRFGAVAAVLAALALWATTRFDQPLIRLRRQFNEAEHAVSANLFDTLSNITTVITLRLERGMESSLAQKFVAYVEPFRRFMVFNELKWFTSSMFVALIYAILAIGYVLENVRADAALHVGGLVTLLAYANQFGAVFNNFSAQYNRVLRFDIDLQAAGEIDAAWRALHGADAPADLPAAWREIDLRSLTYAHAGEGRAVDGVDLVLRRGRRIALVGESGCGKSTLLALLRGLYAPAPGLGVRVDGRPTPFATLNEATTLLPQEPEIFENTILHNITLGLPFDEADVWRACDLAQFSAVARALPGGLRSDIREKGVNLSGGQKQRLALARGLLAARDCPVVLFDEPTSSVDPRTEALIYEAVFAACRDKVLVSALHRLHLLRDFDDIYVMSAGRVVGHGDLARLLATCPEFQDMWRHQAEMAAESE